MWMFNWTLQAAFFVHNSTHKSCINDITLVFGWCQVISSKSRCQLRVFPLYFPDIPYFSPVVYQSISKTQTQICVGKYLSPHGIDYRVIVPRYLWMGELPCNDVINALRNENRRKNVFSYCTIRWLWSHTDDSKPLPAAVDDLATWSTRTSVIGLYNYFCHIFRFWCRQIQFSWSCFTDIN